MGQICFLQRPPPELFRAQVFTRSSHHSPKGQRGCGHAVSPRPALPARTAAGSPAPNSPQRLAQRAWPRPLPPPPRGGDCACAAALPVSPGTMKSDEDGGEARGAGARGLCVLCGLPAAGKSTLARALGQRLRRERGWAVGVVAYDDVLPDAFPGDADGRPLPSPWKLLRQELLSYVELFLQAAVSGCQMSVPPERTEAMWGDFITCLRDQDLISSAELETQTGYLLTKAAASRPLFLLLDDNFYYQSMRYEVYQLARKYSLGFCQLFLDCPLETCLERNEQRAQTLPPETIQLMGRKIERPNPERNAWERNSLAVMSTAPSAASQQLIDLFLTALENPVKCVEDDVEQKEMDRIICSTNILHQADQTLRRIVSATMKEAKDKQLLPYNLKLLAEELNKLKTEFLEDLRQGNQKYLSFQRTIHMSDIISVFQFEKSNVAQRYFSKKHSI
ncbi:L-seryl-tRNA(Sec) kinase [Erinaceus europaeus]|uniref:L-seryl-tRNA(Sec) kinase n=1 Tax=Erinaceus europaeus TaxID=9365 RepID=A0ABM3VS04_ERIEU|nr:L-seryl-tRNA(Sec) kinase [Erinaceus europaeus]